MADVTYRVVVDLSQQGDFAGASTSKLADLDRSVTKIGSGLGKIAGTLSDAFTGAVEKVASLSIKVAEMGAGLGIAATTFGLKFNDEMEQTRISLASIFSAQGVSKDMTDGLNVAADVMKKMRTDSQALPGTFQELSQIMKTISIPGFQSGMNVNTLEQFSAQTMAVAKIAGVSIPVAAREMATLMSGHATSANVMALRLGITGDKAKEFRQMSPEERISVLTKELDKYKGAIDTFSGSFNALSTTLKDNAMFFLGKATEPLFHKIKETISGANEWFSTHKGIVEEFAYNIGTKLAEAWSFGIDKIKEWLPIIVEFSKNFASTMLDTWKKVEPLVAKVAGYIKDSLVHSEVTFDKIKGILEVYAALKVGEGLGPLASGLGQFGLGIGRLLASGGLGPGVGLGAGAMAIPAVAGAVGAIGVADILSDPKNPLHADMLKDLKGINTEWERMVGLFGELKPVMKDFADFLGSEMITMLRSSLTLLRTSLSAYGYILDAEQGKFNKTQLSPDEEVKIDRNMELHAIGAAVGAALSGHAEPSKEIKGGGGTNIQKVEIVVNQQGDPERVARAVMDKMADLSRFKRSSPWAPNYSSSARR